MNNLITAGSINTVNNKKGHAAYINRTLVIFEGRRLNNESSLFLLRYQTASQKTTPQTKYSKHMDTNRYKDVDIITPPLNKD
jgi:hypothetical protein